MLLDMWAAHKIINEHHREGGTPVINKCKGCRNKSIS
jgi:hypothetical protein